MILAVDRAASDHKAILGLANAAWPDRPWTRECLAAAAGPIFEVRAHSDWVHVDAAIVRTMMMGPDVLG